MEKDLGSYRKNYKKHALLKKNIPENPMELFQKWFYAADEDNCVEEANIVNLATVGSDNFPKSRIVLLKRFTWEGFIFYTNYNSEKGKSIAKNPNVCLTFFWHSIERQIIIKGIAEKIAENLSDGYFESRPDGSKLGAWASHQSEVIDSRTSLDKKLTYYENKFKEMEIPRPDYWGGYIVKPISIEFWQGRPNRMHDRLRYTLQENYDWKLERLEP
jgi:pyridoxamine 5'-phosphate oxidase